MTLNTEAQENLDLLKNFFSVPDYCPDPKAFLRKRRALATKLYDATSPHAEYPITAGAFPPSRHDSQKHE